MGAVTRVEGEYGRAGKLAELGYMVWNTQRFNKKICYLKKKSLLLNLRNPRLACSDFAHVRILAVVSVALIHKAWCKHFQDIVCTVSNFLNNWKGTVFPRQDGMKVKHVPHSLWARRPGIKVSAWSSSGDLSPCPLTAEKKSKICDSSSGTGPTV